MRPGTVDPTGMSQCTYLAPVLEEIRKLLKEQVGKADWRKADVTLAEKLGAALMKLRLMKHVEEIEEGKVR